MTVNQIRDAIRFETRPSLDDSNSLVGTLSLAADIGFNQSEADRHPQYLEDLKHRLQEDLLRMLFLDQRREMYQIVQDLNRYHPTQYEYVETLHRLLSVAGFQPDGQVPHVDREATQS